MQSIPSSIVLTQSHLAQLEKHARDSLPNESCAFLLGAGAAQVAVSEVMVVKNAQADRVSFSVPADELLNAYKKAEEKKLQVAGIFHSHPASPKPSSTDARFMEINPVVWVIYSTTESRFAAWIHSDQIYPVEIVVR
ncbi:M67 family metallopeptidase [Nitrososphaera sp.]|uniref:M67 family metallopeptidase n=1 Tax=Nitrososphaera sp. TaxID=1971748 RepID=UPI00185377D7|nr:M67 family metallopeptidase [Nitrososphaera sp.]NWG35989.1 M67 family metallopeptidase [Nitrososphaera sp.]